MIDGYWTGKIIEKLRLKMELRKRRITDDPAILEKVKRRWIPYTACKQECVTIAVDGSCNDDDYETQNPFIVGAKAMDITGKVINQIYDCDVQPESRNHLISVMNNFEVQIAESLLQKSSSDAPRPLFILIDGSFMSWIFNLRDLSNETKHDVNAIMEHFLNLVKEYTKMHQVMILFISKNSDSKTLSRTLNIPKDRDVFYYNQVSNNETGYSFPDQDREPFDRFGVTGIVLYTRLKPYHSMLKLEFVNTSGNILSGTELEDLATKDIPKILDKLSYDCSDGYPFTLALVHQHCAIKKEELGKIISLAGGINDDNQARAVLGEDNNENFGQGELSH